jgi:hypothetical protein
LDNGLRAAKRTHPLVLAINRHGVFHAAAIAHFVCSSITVAYLN